jgi:hypothetical protein
MSIRSCENGKWILGKTFLYNTLIAELKALGHEVVVVASTGIAATLLIGGRTAHSAFRIPIDCDAKDTPRIDGQEALAQKLRRAKIVIVDEVTMINKHVYNFIDATLRSLYSGPEREMPFAGKIVAISGDWKQRLPIVTSGKRPEIVANTIKATDTYSLFETLTLTKNMRTDAEEGDYREWLRLVGNGLNYVEEGSELIAIPDDMLVGDEAALINSVFPADALADPISRMFAFLLFGLDFQCRDGAFRRVEHRRECHSLHDQR